MSNNSSGFLTNGVPLIVISTGKEQAPFDTETAKGASPQSVSISVQRLAALMTFFGNTVSTVGVNGTRWYVGFVIDTPTLLTGISFLIGGTGGTDKAIVELHDSTGALVATSALAGVLVGTAGSFQQIPFTSNYQAAAGQYYLAVQTNGNTAYLGLYNAPTSPLLTGNATGSFGTSASITPPTTYTVAKGPVALPY